VLGSICSICWERYLGKDHHEIVGTASSGDQPALIAELSSLGVPWPRGYASDDPADRAYGLMRMFDDAATVGLDCSEVAGQWVITRSVRTPDLRLAPDSQLPLSA
jgi:hypothetical protein